MTNRIISRKWNTHTLEKMGIKVKEEIKQLRVASNQTIPECPTKKALMQEAHKIERMWDVFMAGATGKLPEEFQPYFDEVVNEEEAERLKDDPEYQEFLRLKEKFKN